MRRFLRDLIIQRLLMGRFPLQMFPRNDAVVYTTWFEIFLELSVYSHSSRKSLSDDGRARSFVSGRSKVSTPAATDTDPKKTIGNNGLIDSWKPQIYVILVKHCKSYRTRTNRTKMQHMRAILVVNSRQSSSVSEPWSSFSRHSNSGN